VKLRIEKIKKINDRKTQVFEIINKIGKLVPLLKKKKIKR
jgi:hypothetical protein